MGDSISISWSYVLLSVGCYILTFLCARQSYRSGRRPFSIFLAAIAYGYIIEYLAVSQETHPYVYHQFIIKLPGPVPLEICLGWGVIFYSVIQTSRWLKLPWLLRPVLSGLLATGIDFVMDPVAVHLKFWTWNMPVQWFGAPWANFTGWFTVIVSFSLVHCWGYEKCTQEEERKGLFRDLLIAFLSMIPSFLIYVGSMKAYMWLIQEKGFPEEVLIAIIFGGGALLILRHVPRFRRDKEINWLVLAVPVFFYVTCLFLYFANRIYVEFETLVITLPALAFLGMICFCWPYLDKLFPSKGVAARE